MKRFLKLLTFLLLANNAWAQHSSNAYHELADSLYRHHHYKDAAGYYQKALKKAPDPGTLMLKIARSYAKLNEIASAETWFAQARESKAPFSNEDTYLNAQVLAIQGKRQEAQTVLQELLRKDPFAGKEQQFLLDLVNHSRYYKDSARYLVRSLPINTPVSEFAPAFYKDGIVYASASALNRTSKKYHWDNSHFLNLYFSRNDGNTFTKPTLFERDLNTKYHDGPAAFYNEHSSMIVNRNERSAPDAKRGHELWHLTLLEGTYNKEKSDWILSPVTFGEQSYSVTHPHISEDGKILYFVSDKPGGYGGTDIYRTVRINGKWSEPFNVGPVVNTAEDEAFPFAVDNTLYFASNGHGGLGGLDIYKSENSINGFSPPVNLGSPINSTKDDFSLIIKSNRTSGYFASSRNGNDDLFSFEYIPPVIRMAGYTYDGLTNEALAGTTVRIINTATDDQTIDTDDKGNFRFDLPEGTDFILIGTKDNRVGMSTGISSTHAARENMVHQLAVFSDTSLIACVGVIKDAQNKPGTAASTIVIDETTNETIAVLSENSMINFPGRKNHSYRVQITNVQGDTTIHRLSVKPSDKEAKTWTMVLKESMTDLMLAARVFIADNNEPLAGAQVRITTFSEPQFNLVTTADGIVEYNLPKGTAYLLVASTPMFTGMFTGVAEEGADKKFIIHPVPAYGDKASDEKIIMSIITNEKGDLVGDARVTVTDRESGEKLPVSIQDGVVSFKGKHNRSYNIVAEHDDYQITREEHTVSSTKEEVTKLSVILKKEVETPEELSFRFRVVDAATDSSISGAEVTVISFVETDQQMLSDEKGEGGFKLPAGLAYMIIAKKDGYVGSFAGESESAMSSEFVTHKVLAHNEKLTRLVVAQVIDAAGDRVEGATVSIVDTKTGKAITAEVSKGVVSFHGDKGKVYAITVQSKDHNTLEQNLKVVEDEDPVQKLSLVMEKRPVLPGTSIIVDVIRKDNRTPLSGARLSVITLSGSDLELVADENGRASFSIEKAEEYMVLATGEGYSGLLNGTAPDADDFKVIEAVPEGTQSLPVIARVKDGSGEAAKISKVTVMDNTSKQEVEANVQDGFVSFKGKKGTGYTVTVESNGETATVAHNVPQEAREVDTFTIVVKGQTKTVLARNNNVKVTGKPPVSGDRLIVFQTESGEVRAFVMRDGLLNEITEENGELYLNTASGNVSVGQGSLQKAAEDQQLLTRLNIPVSSVVMLRNIFFDFNNATINETAAAELRNVYTVLKSYPALKLVIRAHADDRGQDAYNYYLSGRRARAVLNHLVNSGIQSSRLVLEPMGETAPAVRCVDADCSEEDHGRNRRAEFFIRSGKGPRSLPPPALVKSSPRNMSNPATTAAGGSTADAKSRYAALLAKYGDKELEGLTFRVSVGAYRHNTGLTFDHLNDLAPTEKLLRGEITYYYLGRFKTLNEAERVKQVVSARGIPDAYISVFYKDSFISFKEFTNLVE